LLRPTSSVTLQYGTDMRSLSTTALVCITISVIGCTQRNSSPADRDQEQHAPKSLVEDVLTKEEQAALTPEQVLQNLKEGNDRFLSNTLTVRDHSAQVRASAPGQYPKAIVISCVDSRVEVADIFDKGIGDLFIGRVAGNFVNTDLLGSCEFACKVSGAKLIVILGHKNCGAVKAAIDNVQLGNITPMLDNIKPAVSMSQDFTGDRTSKNDDFVYYVAQNNVRHAMQVVRDRSPILKAMEDSNEIDIVGAYYDIRDGRVTFIK